MKRLIYLFIVIIIIIFTSSALNNPSRTLSKQEVASLLYPDKHIEVDTLGKNQYIVRFMNGENEVNRLELLTQTIDIRKDTTSVNNKREDSLGLKEIAVRGTIDTISTFYELTISENRTKIAIKRNKKNKSTGYIYSFYRPEDFEETLYQPVQYYISADSILVYNENGKLMYGLDADSVGWDEDPGPRFLAPIQRIPPYVYIRALSDNGELILSSYHGETIFGIDHRIMSKEGEEIIKGRYEGGVNNYNVISIEDKTYMLLKKNKIYYLYTVKNNVITDSLALGKEKEYLWGQLRRINDTIVALLDDYAIQTVKLIEDNKIIDIKTFPKGKNKHLKFYSSKDKIYYITKDSLIYSIEENKIKEILKLNIFESIPFCL